MEPKTPIPERVMLIAAHPDDPEFGCGATIAKWAAEGKEITYLLLTSGDKGSHNRYLPPGRLARIREEEQREAAKVLGVKEVLFLRHADGILENTLELRRQIAGILRAYKPHVVLTIDPWRRYQLHPDHRAAGQAALDAIFAAREWYIFSEQLVEDGDPWRVKEAYLFWTDNPDHWEDVSCCIERRIEALKKHVSQVGHRQEGLEERIRKVAREVGEKVGFEYAEAFKHLTF